MKRNEIVKSLLEEGFSEKTLVNFSDRQLMTLANRILGESDVMISKGDPEAAEKIAMAKAKKQSIETYEGEVKEESEVKPKKLDKKSDSKTDDKKKDIKPTSGAVSGNSDVRSPTSTDVRSPTRTATSTDAYTSGNVTVTGGAGAGATTTVTIKSDPEKQKRLKSGQGEKQETKEELIGGQKKLDKNKNGKIDAEDFKLLKGKKKENIKEWVSEVTNKKFHSFTSKKEIMEMIQFKLKEDVGSNVKKGHNGIPEFMTYDSISDVETVGNSPITKPAPTKPKENPTTKPRTPYSPKPGEKSKPKALKEKEVKNEVK